MTSINTSYSYIGSILAGMTKPADGTTGTSTGGNTTTQPEQVTTDLREDLGVEVTLSPAALKALAEQAQSGGTPDDEQQITEKMKQILSAIFLTSAKQADIADDALPPPTGNAATDEARRAAAKQATDFLDGKATNPFKGQSMSDLAAVIVDATGKYTVNERRAAYSEFARQDNAQMLDALTPKTDFDKKVNDAEVPQSGTPERLEAAKKATDFLNGKGSNPFDSLTRDQLTAVIANDTGDYTVNERRAALAKRDELEKAILTKLAATPSSAEKTVADNQTVSGSPERVQRAQQATRFVNGWTQDNPFAGLTREELNAIVYDESTTYTTNEKRAAYTELKQYLPASSIPTDPKDSSTKNPDGTDKNTDQDDDPYSTQGAYSSYLMQQVIRANNTSYLLSLLGGGNGSSSYGMGLAAYLSA